MNTRNHGGRRAGSGGKRGAIYAPTRRKQALQAQWEAAVALEFGAIIEAQLRAAIGTSVVFATVGGIWTHFPDPDATILARVQAGDEAYRLTTVALNHALLTQIFDRLLGRTREALEVEIPALPMVSDADLAAPLAALLGRWHPASS